MKCTAALRKFLIPSGPLLHQCRGKRATQAEGQTEEPQHIDPDSRRCWLEWLSALVCNDHERRAVGDVDKLLRYLSKERVGRIAGIGR